LSQKKIETHANLFQVPRKWMKMENKVHIDSLWFDLPKKKKGSLEATWTKLLLASLSQSDQ
jgi:hypothetical protein